jgi:hypothetical protein
MAFNGETPICASRPGGDAGLGWTKAAPERQDVK